MINELKVVFMGTPNFSIKILEMLIETTNVIGVVTQPDKMVGRKKEIIFSEVKKVALENNLKVFQPVNIKKDYQDILALDPDIIITCAYGQIIPKEVLDYPKYGCINVHASLLPKLRGGSPIHHAIIDGYKETGITIMYMDLGMDDGDIITSKSTPILEDDTYLSLHDKLKVMGAELLKETLPKIISGDITRIKQNKEEVSFGFNIKREDEQLNFNLKIEDIYNKIRGLNPDPGSYFLLNGKIVKVYGASKVVDDLYKDRPNGEIVKVSKKAFYIKALDGLIEITELQLEGKKRMDAASFLNGTKENLLGVIVNKGV